MDCPKCGAKKIRKLRAGVWHCRRHGTVGMENGQVLDRGGNPLPPQQPTKLETKELI